MSVSLKSIARLESEKAAHAESHKTDDPEDHKVYLQDQADYAKLIEKAKASYAKKLIRVANRKAKKAALKEVDPVTPKAPKKPVKKIKVLTDPKTPVSEGGALPAGMDLDGSTPPTLNAKGRKQAKSALAKHMAAFKAGDVPETDPKELF